MSILETIDGALRDYDASGDAMRWVPEDKRADVTGGKDMPPLVVSLTVDLSGFEEAFRHMAEVLQPLIEAQFKAAAQMMHSLSLAFYPKQHQRCVTCHPWRKPKPLAVDGREYQRRLKARRRRKP